MTKLYMSLFVLSLVFVNPAAAAPGAATLVAPSGDVVGTTIAFSWESVPESTWYLFWLGKGSPTAFIMQQWYSAEQAGCANGGTCTITLTPPLNAGAHTWFIQTWGAGATGPWSTGKVFAVKDPMPNWSSVLPPDRRYTLVFNGEAVLDNETGLTWQRTPSASLATFR